MISTDMQGHISVHDLEKALLAVIKHKLDDKVRQVTSRNWMWTRIGSLNLSTTQSSIMLLSLIKYI